MKNIPITPAQEIAHSLDADQNELDHRVITKLSDFFSRANTAGLEQAILDEMGTGAVNAVTAYAAYHFATGFANSTATPAEKIALMTGLQQLVATLAFPLSASAPAPNFAAFVPQVDGTVVFVAPTPPPEIPELP